MSVLIPGVLNTREFTTSAGIDAFQSGSPARLNQTGVFHLLGHDVFASLSFEARYTVGPPAFGINYRVQARVDAGSWEDVRWAANGFVVGDGIVAGDLDDDWLEYQATFAVPATGGGVIRRMVDQIKIVPNGGEITGAMEYSILFFTQATEDMQVRNVRTDFYTSFQK